MILRSSLSLRGLYLYDNSLFDNLVVPDIIDKDILITNLLAETSELEVLYPDSDYMKELIGYWSQKQLPVWQKYADTLGIEYDPLNNYVKQTEHHGDKDTTANTTGNSNSTSTDSVKGYNETEWVDSNKTVSSDTGNSNRTTTGHDNYNRTVKGNVGIRSFSDLITEEMKLREKYNLYDLLIRDFKLRFCILVY